MTSEEGDTIFDLFAGSGILARILEASGTKRRVTDFWDVTTRMKKICA